MREIRYFPDHGRKYPLWESGTDKYAMGPEDFGLSAELSRGLRELMRFWNTHFIENDTDEGFTFIWDSPENEQRYLAEGDRLLEQLRTEVEDFAVVLDQRRD